jgi:di/tricarboxylate transporter
MIAVIVILGFTVFLFVSEVVRVDVAALATMVIIGLTGLIPGYPGLLPLDNLFDGFSSNAVMAIIAVMIIGAGLDKTGIMDQAAGKILKYGGQTEGKIIATISFSVGCVSSFMQNIGAAALFLPVVSRIARRGNLPISRLLMPMGFCAILGGTVTMVGSSPLILLNDLIKLSNEHLPQGVEALEPFTLFSVTPIGIALVVTGILYFILFGRFVLPVVKDKPQESGNTLTYFREVYGIAGEVYEARVATGSPLIGAYLSDIEEAGRDGWIVAIRNRGKLTVAPRGDTELDVGAELAIMGRYDAVEVFCRNNGLYLKPEMDVFGEILSTTAAGIAEVVIPPDSTFIGKSLKEISLRNRYGATALAVFRIDEVIDSDIGDLPLQAGDTLVLHGRWVDFGALAEDRNLVTVTDFPRDDTRPRKLPYAAAAFCLSIALIIFSGLPLSVALMSGALMMILTGVLRIDEAYKSIGWQSVFLIASLIPLGIAFETTNTAAWMAQQLIVLLGDVPIWVLQTVVAIVATIFSLVMSNVGATVLLVPIAVNIAIGVGGNPAVFALTVALATSNSFLIPTHQVNALIMGPGGYRVKDFIRAGGVMTLLTLLVMILMLNIIF